MSPGASNTSSDYDNHVSSGERPGTDSSEYGQASGVGNSTENSMEGEWG